MSESPNEDESELGRPVAGLGCYIGIRMLTICLLTMFLVVALILVVNLTVVIDRFLSYNEGIRLWISIAIMLGLGFIIGTAATYCCITAASSKKDLHSKIT